MIKGKRIYLRAVEEKDLELLLQWTNDPDIASQVIGWTFPLSMVQQRDWFVGSFRDQRTQRFVIESPEHGAIGLTGLWDIDWHSRMAMTGVKLGATEIRGQGYGTDAILTLMNYAFYNVGLNRLWATILSFNVASYQAYVEKCGWQVEGVSRQEVYRNGKFHDVIRVAALAEDFASHPLHDDYTALTHAKQWDQQVTILDRHWSKAAAALLGK